MIKHSGIYYIKNLVNNKIYVGSSTMVNIRLTRHRHFLKNNTHCNKHLQSAYNEYGKENFLFHLLERCASDKLVERENYYINLFDASNREKGYNQATVTDTLRNNFSEESKLNKSISKLKFYNNYSKFKAINIIESTEVEFTNLTEAADYLIDNGYAKSTRNAIKQNISCCLRCKLINNGKTNKGAIRRTVGKHRWVITE